MISRRTLCSFLRPPLFYAILGTLFIFVFIYSLFQLEVWYYSLIFLLIPLLGVGNDMYTLYYWVVYSLGIRSKPYINEIDYDFNNGVILADNHIRLGDRYIIGKCGVTAVNYNEISRVYEYVHKSNYVVDGRQLRIVTKKGRDRILCKLPRKGIPKNELNKIFGIINHHNQSVKFGYNPNL